VILDHGAITMICGDPLDVRSATTFSVEGVIVEGHVNSAMMDHPARFAASLRVVLVAEGTLANTNIPCRRCAMISPEACVIEVIIASTLTNLEMPSGGQHARCVRTTRGATALAEKAANTRMM